MKSSHDVILPECGYAIEQFCLGSTKEFPQTTLVYYLYLYTVKLLHLSGLSEVSYDQQKIYCTHHFRWLGLS